jgi:hypothetical protein
MLCSKPIRSGSFVLLEHGELLHVRCRSRILEEEAMETAARAEAAQDRSARLMLQNLRLRRVRPQDPCPVCGQPAAVLDWRPAMPWLAFDGCSCGGFFVWSALLDSRLPGLSEEERGQLTAHIRLLRRTNTEAWLTTRDGTVSGEMHVRDHRPDRLGQDLRLAPPTPATPEGEPDGTMQADRDSDPCSPRRS